MFTTIENFLSNFSFLTLFLSMIIYWIEISNFTFISTGPLGTSTLKEGRNLVMETNTEKSLARFSNGQSAESLFSTAKSPFLMGASAPIQFNNNKIQLPQIAVLASNLSLFLLLTLRWKESGHFPLSNLYESLMFLSWTLTTIHLFLDFNLFQKIQLGTESAINGYSSQLNKNLFIAKLLGSITTPGALFTNAFATFSLPKEMQEASPLVPALQSNWLMMHVTVMILSYGALICGSLLAIAFLVITGGKEISISLEENQSSFNSETFQTKASYLPKNLEKLAQTFDNLSYRILGIGFPFLTIGILSGAVWANEAWGSYWSWDPKETWALLTWLVFAIYLHTRLNKGWQGKKPALIASLGFVSVWVCYLGVNLLGEGLHSYGWFTQ